MEREGAPGRLRLFAALALPDDVLETIERWWQTASQAIPRRHWRLLPREGWHLTLAFYGEIEGGLLRDLEQALAEQLADQNSLQLHSHGVGTFPSPERARVFWLGIEGQGLDAIALRCHRAASALPATGSRRTKNREHPFRGHLTLARARHHARPFDPRCLIAMPPPPELSWHASEVELIRSRLLPDGARYERLTSFPLSQAG